MLIRLAVAYSLVVYVINGLLDAQTGTKSWAVGLVELLVSAALLIGFLTPIAALVAAAGSLGIGVARLFESGVTDKASLAILLAVMSTALLLLGPGAYSLDAHLFGRRQIIIPESPPPPL